MAYTSLKDLYSEHVKGKTVQVLPRQLVVLTEQAGILEPGRPYRWTDFNLQNPTELFNKVDGSMGRGEYSIACILWGVSSYEELMQAQAKRVETQKRFSIIQGQGASYDVHAPDDKKYEVKELDIKTDPEANVKTKTVRTGANGKQAAHVVISVLNKFLDEILKAYSSVDDSGKDAINDAILKSSVAQKVFASKSKSKFASGEQSAGPYEDRRTGWTVEKYITEILRKSSVELSQGILLAPKISLGSYKGRPAIIFSLEQFVNALIEISTTTPSGDNPSIKDLYDAMIKNYRINADNQQEKDFFEQEARNIDRMITQKQCTLFKKCTNQDTFKATIRSLRLDQGLEEVRNALANSIYNTFPETGLFIVNQNMFVYIPKERLGDFIYANQISGGAPKIGLKETLQGL